MTSRSTGSDMPRLDKQRSKRSRGNAVRSKQALLAWQPKNWICVRGVVQSKKIGSLSIRVSRLAKIVAMDVDALLTARSDASPSGENLEYDESFSAMELAAVPSAEGAEDGATPGEPNYSELQEAALAVLERSHDLRAAAFLALAGLRTNGLEAGRDAIRYIRGCLEQHWETCYPEIEDGDVVMRANAVAALSDPSGVVAALRRAPLATSPVAGSFSLRDISIASGDVPVPEDMENVPTRDGISGALADTPEEVLSARIAAAQDIATDLAAIEAVFDDRAPGVGPDLKRINEALARIKKALGGASKGEAQDEPEDASSRDKEGGGAPVAASEPAAPMKSGPVRSPDDVRAMLDQIIAYYRREEPSSPVPILLGRAKKLVGADFLAIVKDIAPEGMENVALVGGLEDEDEDDD